jgi:hypothetical protein
LNTQTIVALVAALSMSAGCATVSSMADEFDGEERSFAVPHACACVRDALEPAFRGLRFEIKTLQDLGTCDRDVVAVKGVSAFGWGEIVRVTLRDGDAGGTRLSVTTSRRLATNVTAKDDWSAQILAAVTSQLDVDVSCGPEGGAEHAQSSW